MGSIAATKAVVGWGAAGLFAFFVYKIIFPSKPKGVRPPLWVCYARSHVGRPEAIMSRVDDAPMFHMDICLSAN